MDGWIGKWMDWKMDWKMDCMSGWMIRRKGCMSCCIISYKFRLRVQLMTIVMSRPQTLSGVNSIFCFDPFRDTVKE